MDSGRVLYSFNKDEKMLIASTTKIMTAIIAIENMDTSIIIEVGDEIDKVYGSMIYVKKGEMLSLESLLYGLMLRSGNDAAMTIAENTLGYDKFIMAMNNKAKELKMYNTIFENPHGLDDESKNYSTAYDLSLLMKYAMKNPEFVKITNTKKYKVVTNLNTHIWYNKNQLLSSYKYATGGKIGYTKKSGHIFVSAASKDDKNLVVVTIKDTDRFNTHEYLYEKYFDEYDKYQILDKYTFFVNEDYYKKYHLYIKNDFYMLLKKKEIKDLLIETNLSKNKKIKNDTKVGYVSIKLKDKLIHNEPIYASIKESKIKKIKSILFFWKK
jgi:D-alanyl-D-alanine carboxypeptidase